MTINLNNEFDQPIKVTDAQAKYIIDLIKQNGIKNIFQHSTKQNGKIVYTIFINRIMSKSTGSGLIKALINKEDIVFEFNGSTDISKKDLREYMLKKAIGLEA